MVGWLCPTDRWAWRPKLEQVTVLDQPLLRAALPTGKTARRLRQGARALERQGVRRVLLSPGLEGPGTVEILERYGLQGLDPLPLCRAQGARLALFLLRDLPAPRRCVALRGEQAGPSARMLALRLCPQVGALLLDFDRGEEELAQELRARYGAAPLHLGQGPRAQVSLELSPRAPLEAPTLRLWGEPDLAGLTLRPPERLPAGLPEGPFLSLLWETGRAGLEDMEVALSGEWP